MRTSADIVPMYDENWVELLTMCRKRVVVFYGILIPYCVQSRRENIPKALQEIVNQYFFWFE